MACLICKKKTSVILVCKCGIECCSSCIDAEVHKCKRDFKKEQKDKLTAELPVVTSPKITKI